MALLPTLPPPPPQLDFPAMEQERQALVQGYRDMTQAMLAALDKKMDEFVREGLAVKSAPASYQQGAKAPQLSRRDKIAKVLVRLKIADGQADFEPGGKYANVSDRSLYGLAKVSVEAYRRQRAAAK